MITGTVIDKDSKIPLNYSTVSIFNALDSSLVNGSITDLEGRFTIPVESGKYFAKIQFVTYKDEVISSITVNSAQITNLGVIDLTYATEELNEVVVQAERTQMEMNLDKKVYNVGKDLSNLGGSATDILSNLPALTVDIDGNVELRGSSGVRVLIDGKPSGLVGLSSSDALRQLQGNMIESIEIITNPSARYDAEGMAGIINIILKKDSKKGINGSFQVNTGYPHNHGVSANMNFRRERINFFVNYGVNYRENPGGGRAFQTYNLDEPAPQIGVSNYNTLLDRSRNRTGLNNSIRFGSDFYINAKTSLTAAFLYRYSDQLNKSNIDYSDFSLDGDLLYFTGRDDEETESDNNLEYSINFTREFDRKGHKLTADFQYQDNNEIEKSDIIQSEGGTIESSVPELFQRVKNDEGEKRTMLQADYVQPFGLKGQFEAGFRSTDRHVKNIYDVDERDSEDVGFTRLTEFSTDFAYNEKVQAVYAIVSNQEKEFSWQLGLRSELTNIDSRQAEDTVDGNWNYINFFPSAFFTYKLTEITQTQLSYSRRINRPGFRDLNPFSSFSDNRNFRVGNPSLQPEFTDSFELGLLQNFENSSLYYGAYYRYTDGLITRVSFEPNEDGERVRKPYNIGQRHQFGLETNISKEFTDWYRTNTNINFFRSETVGNIGDTLNLDATAMSLSGRTSNIFKIGKKIDAQINFNYRAPEKRPQGKRLAMYSLDFGVTRDVFSDNGTLALSVADIFNTRKYRYETDTENFSEEGNFQRSRGPVAQLTFTYRLNQKKQRPERGEGRGEFGGGDDF